MTSTTVAIAAQNTPTHVGCLLTKLTSTADCDRESQRTLLRELSSGQIRRGRRTAVRLTVIEAVNGDFDGDGDVDSRDFLAWQRGGSPNPLSAGDLAEWQANYGNDPLAAMSVPEPSALGMVSVFAFLAIRARRH